MFLCWKLLLKLTGGQMNIVRTASVGTLELMIVDKSPKRVSHSLKEPLLRISLVHPSVSFKIIDIESEYDLLCTRASPSPLPLLSSGFGIHLSSLNNLNAIDGSFKLTRYILGCDVYTVKVYRPKLMDNICDKLSFLHLVSLKTIV
ncbi:DNA mismatch repair protein MLH3-like isoform X1 [Solanum dulcamara]|uniref:DNA mismatch repair protein MLH3-like isoform X1 n=1 Tax=Solanum dulcamara TaxID=45834 RepID=UPI002485A78F|nr:DNA mismatch repair protein MLH3-like isoform X1 [Solanum dulcamara]XP_055803052.1 DNA mismatch repair protein MLH3-like isoform X1 [Solanum dulcamara]